MVEKPVSGPVYNGKLTGAKLDAFLGIRVEE